MLYREDLHNLSGLFNEIMTSAHARLFYDKKDEEGAEDFVVVQKKMTGLDESTMLTMCEAPLEKLLSWIRLD